MTTAFNEILLFQTREKAREAVQQQGAMAATERRILQDALQDRDAIHAATAALHSLAVLRRQGELPSIDVAAIAETLEFADLGAQLATAAAELVPAPSRTLRSSVRQLCAWIGATASLRVRMEAHGRPRRLRLEEERALYLTAYECLRVALGLRSCTRIWVELRFGVDVVTLIVIDNGDRGPLHLPADATQSVLTAVGGSLTVTRRRTGHATCATVPCNARA